MKNIIKSELVIDKSPKIQRFIAFLWGLAEASLFFIVPDVWLTIISRRKLDRAKYEAIGFAILGALVGGTIIYWLARSDPDRMLGLIAEVPGINRVMVDKVRVQVETGGLPALLLGPLQGIPFKIYAAQWGITNGNLIWFWLISIPARGIRFVIASVLTRLIWIFGQKKIKFWNKYDLVLLLSFWVLFYLWYLSFFGW